MSVEYRFVKLTRPDQLIGRTIYPTGSVVEVERHRAEKIIRAGYAEPHSGPASFPEVETPKTSKTKAGS